MLSMGSMNTRRLCRLTHRVGVFGSHAGSLDDQLLVPQLHPVEPGDRLLQGTTPAGETRHDGEEEKEKIAALPGRWH